VVEGRVPEAGDITVRTLLEPAGTSGNPQLLERLVANLVDNALRYNVPRGEVTVRTSTDAAGRAVIRVSNSGPLVPPDEMERLVRPFQRLGTARTGHGDGVGLGLSIVAAIADAHDAALATHPRAGGGLEVTVAFPAPVRAVDVAPDPLPVPRHAGALAAPMILRRARGH
jgi:signal transduction histidine kinase